MTDPTTRQQMKDINKIDKVFELHSIINVIHLYIGLKSQQHFEIYQHFLLHFYSVTHLQYGDAETIHNSLEGTCERYKLDM